MIQVRSRNSLCRQFPCHTNSDIHMCREAAVPGNVQTIPQLSPSPWSKEELLEATSSYKSSTSFQSSPDLLKQVSWIIHRCEPPNTVTLPPPQCCVVPAQPYLWPDFSRSMCFGKVFIYLLNYLFPQGSLFT